MPEENSPIHTTDFSHGQPGQTASDTGSQRLTHESESFLSESEKQELLRTTDIFDRFIAAGVKRSIRSIARYADPNAKRMICKFDAGDRQYFCTPQSVDALIEEEREIDNRKRAQDQVPPPVSATTRERQTTNVPPPPTGESVPESESDNRELRAKIRQLEFESEVNKRLMVKLEADRESVFDRFAEMGRQIGSLENQLTQIDAPKPAADSGRQETNEVREAAFTETPKPRETNRYTPPVEEPSAVSYTMPTQKAPERPREEQDQSWGYGGNPVHL